MFSLFGGVSQTGKSFSSIWDQKVSVLGAQCQDGVPTSFGDLWPSPNEQVTSPADAHDAGPGGLMTHDATQTPEFGFAFVFSGA